MNYAKERSRRKQFLGGRYAAQEREMRGDLKFGETRLRLS
jgi:hypothetical protein